MPIVNRTHVPVMALADGSLPDAPPVEDPGIFSILGSALRQSNTVGSLLSDNTRTIENTIGDDPEYSAWDEIKGTSYEQHWDVFAQSNNRQYTSALKTQVDQEDRDRSTLAAGGWTGTLANLGAAIVDPTLLIPGGGEIIKAEGGYRIAKAALNTSLIAGRSVAAQEAGLQLSQQDRTAEESAFNIGGGIVLGGLLGAGASALLSRGERAVAAKGFDSLVEQGGGGLSSAPVTISMPLDQLSVDGTSAGAAAKATAFLSPNLRLNFSPSKVARQTAQELAESSVYQTGHAEGATVGPSVERLAGMSERGRMASAVQSLNNAYRDMKKANISMSFNDFDEAVGRAMRQEDVGANDYISRAAKELRGIVVDPLFREGQAVGLYDEGDSVAFAPSYFPRQYRSKVLVANEPTIKAEWSEYMGRRIAGQYGEEADALRGKLGEFDQQAGDLNLSAEDRASLMTHLQGQSDALDAANPEHIDRSSQINELRRMKPSGWQDEVARIKNEGGEGLSSYLKQRSGLRSRIGRVDFGYAGLEDRQARIASSIEDAEDANQRSLRRLVARGAGFQRLTDKIDPKKLASEMASLKNAFADVLARSERATERSARAAERMGDNAPAGMAERLMQDAIAQASRHERLNSLAERIEHAEHLDPEAQLQAARDAIHEVTAEVSDVHGRRAAKIQRLMERQKAVDPARIGERVARISGRKADTLRTFFDKWEIRNLGENIDPLNLDAAPDFSQMAKEIINDVFAKLTGRDYGSSASVAPEYMTPIERGPVRERTLPIPDWMLAQQGVLEHRASEVLHRYARTLSADVELTRKFGDPRLDQPLKRLAEEYDRLRQWVTDPKELASLHSRQKADQRDLEALRDLIRGTYRAKENASNYGRVIRAVGNFNFIRSLGGVVVSSLSDVYRPAMVHGLVPFMSEGVAPLLKNLKAVKMSAREARLAGNITDTVLAHRITSIAGISDPLERGTVLERGLQSMSGIAAKWSGLNLWTDGVKSIAAMMSQNRLLDGSADQRLLAFLGIDGETGRAIRAQFADHGEVLDGVHIANTERWTDQDAVRAFRAAVGKDIDSTIVTPGKGDVPLFMHTPTGRLITQFSSFTLASHQKVLLRGLQESKARFAISLVGMTGIGMLSAYLKALRSGREGYDRFMAAAQNPGYLIGEGLDNSGVFTLGFDASNRIEKLTQPTGFTFNPLKAPMQGIGAAIMPQSPKTGESVRFGNRGPWGTLLGPSASLIDDSYSVAKGAVHVAKGSDFGKPATRAAVRFLPFNTFYGMKEAIQALEGDSPYAARGAGAGNSSASPDGL